MGRNTSRMLRLRLVAAAYVRRIALRSIYVLGASILAWQALILLTLAIPITAAGMVWIEVGIFSLCSLVLFLPLDPEALRRDLRRVDPQSILEALEEAPPGASRSLLSVQLQKRFAQSEARWNAIFGLLAKKAGRENRHLLRASIRFLLLSVLIQALAFAATGTFAFAPRELRDGAQAGVRLSVPGGGSDAEEADREPGGSTPGRRTLSRREDRDAQGEEDADSIQKRSESEARPGPRTGRDAGEARRRDEADPTRSGMPAGRTAGVSGDSGSAQNADASSEGAPQPAQDGDAPPESGASAEAGSGGKGESRAPAAPSPGGMPGWQKTPDTKVPSPLLDYRARLERVLASTRGKSASATGALAAGEAETDPVRAIAAAARSFRLPTGAQAAGDPYADVLRSRWARLRAGLP